MWAVARSGPGLPVGSGAGVPFAGRVQDVAVPRTKQSQPETCAVPRAGELGR